MNSIALVQQKIANVAQYFQSIERIGSQKDVDSVNGNLTELLEWLPGPVTPEKLLRVDQNLYVDWYSIARNEYSIILDSVLRLIDKDWPGAQQQEHGDGLKLLTRLLTIDHNYEFCIESVSALIGFRQLEKYPVLVHILEQIVTSESFLVSLIVDLSYKQELSALEVSNLNDRQQRAIQLLASVPNVVANQLKGQFTDVFTPQSYSGYVLIAILKAVYFVSEANGVHKTTVFGTTFISKLFGRILIDFNSERNSAAIPKVINVFQIWANKNEIYRETIQNVLLMLNRNAIEVISEYLLESGKINQLLGAALQQSSDWRYCFGTKLPLLTYHRNDRVIINLIRHLSHVSQKDEELLNVFIDVLKLWSSKTSIASQSVDHHLYLTKFIAVSAAVLDLNRSGSHSIEIRKTIHRGVQNHIESLNAMVRAMGMITAEIICNQFDEKSAKEEDELHFDYEAFSVDTKEMVRTLQELSQLNFLEYDNDEVRLDDEDAVLSDLLASVAESRQSKQIIASKRTPTAALTPNATTEIVSLSISQPALIKSSVRNTTDDDDLDSDDDLEPYDMSNDTSVKADKSPKYLIDLRENLLETDDPDVFESSLEVCEKLIMQKLPNDDVRVGLELLQLLIDLDRKFYLENFDALRFAGCVAICCCYPKECAEHLCREIHSEVGRYSIVKKTMMLDILSQTARSLSKITKTTKDNTEDVSQMVTMPKKLTDLNSETKRLDEARNIICKRIENKTRRFASKTPHPFINAQKNRFSAVAGYFFFPLLYGFGKQQLMLTSSTSSLKYDTDNILLLAFLNTISAVTLASQNCLIVSKFGPEIFGLSSVLRFHNEPKVRLGVLHMIASAFIAIPKNELLTYCFNDICEVQLWLDQVLSMNIVRGEKNSECREVAKHVMELCLNTIN